MVWRGVVDRVTDDGRAWVTVPRRGRDWSFGPCPRLETVSALVAGDAVLVTAIEGIPDLVVVLGRLADAG